MIHYSQRFDIYSFSSSDKLAVFLHECLKTLDILLIGSLFNVDGLALEKVRTVIRLADSFDEAIGGKVAAVYKYRHTELLVKDLLNMHSKNSINNMVLPGKNKTLIAAVVSSSGGCGKSSMAVGLSILSCRRGMKALYLNIEDVPSTCSYLKGSSDRSFSDIIYYIKEKDCKLSLKLEGACCYDPASGVSYFLPPDSAIQMQELTPDDLAKLIDTLKAASLFDIVFVDMAAGIGQKELYLLKSSDVIIKVIVQGFIPEIKEEVFEKALSNMEGSCYKDVTAKTVKILNRYNANMSEKRYDDSYLSRFKAVINESEKLHLYNGEKSLLEMDPLFSAALGNLLDAILIENSGLREVNGGNNG